MHSICSVRLCIKVQVILIFKSLLKYLNKECCSPCSISVFSFICGLYREPYYHLVSRSHHFSFGILPSLNSPQDLLLLASCHIDRNRGIYQEFLPLHAAELLATAPDPLSKARLLSASKKESDSWLHTLPVTSLGLRMDDNTIRIAIGLRLGTPLVTSNLVLTPI